MRKAPWLAVSLMAALSLMSTRSSAQAKGPQVGDLAPDFTLQASDGQTYTLSKLRGQHVVLAWFPKAFTAG